MKGNDGGTGQGSPGGGPNKEGKNPAQPLDQSPATLTATTSEDDGSSPLIPILIAIVALAAISVAVVMIRQRRQGGGGSAPSVSPKAS